MQEKCLLARINLLNMYVVAKGIPFRSRLEINRVEDYSLEIRETEIETIYEN